MINYPEFLETSWATADVPRESMCRATTERWKGVGMRWDEDHAEALMALEVLDQSGDQSRTAAPARLGQAREAGPTSPCRFSGTCLKSRQVNDSPIPGFRTAIACHSENTPSHLMRPFGSNTQVANTLQGFLRSPAGTARIGFHFRERFLR